MFRTLKATAIVAAAGLSVVGVQVLAASSAGATPAHQAVPARPGYQAPRARVAKRSITTAVQHGVARSTSVRPQVVPVSSFSPACYGDSRSIAPVGGAFDPVSFGSFYNCSKHEWTFEIQTADSWAKTSLGDLTIFIDTSGSFDDGCGGFEYQAFVAQVSPGVFQADLASSGGDPTGQNCTFGPLISEPMSITSNTVAVSFPAAGLMDPNTGSQGTAIAWTGLLQSLTEAQSTTFEGQFVPAATFIDGPVEGSVYDSIPAAYPSAYCGNSPPSAPGAYNATTNNGPAAAAALRKAGFANVRDDSEGIVSFTGDGAAASRVLSAAGVSSKVAIARPMRPASYYMAPAANPVNDPGYSTQWNLPAVGAPGAWAVTHGSSSIVVADIDTGVDFTHTDLMNNLVAGEDETTSPGTPMPTSSGNTDTGQTASGHGTAVAGVVAATTDNSTDLASLGWNTSVEPVKVNFDDPNVDAEIAAGIDWAANNTTNPVSVINLSLGGPCYDPTIATPIDNALKKGILVVVAAGNEAIHPGFDPNEGFSDAPSYPAADPCLNTDESCIIGVGATGKDGYRASYSDTGSYVTLVAPGASGNACPQLPTPCPPSDDLPLLQAGGGTTSGAGTSFAAPQVAATAALILAFNPNLTPSQVRELIVGTAADRGPGGNDIEYGAGLLNASAALADTPPTTAGFGTFYSSPPTRILDTRIGLGAPQAKLGPGATIALTIPSASSDSAVVLNVTAIGTKSSLLSVWPAGQPRPTASNINFLPGRAVPNLVTVKVGTGGAVDIYNAVGSTDVIADLEGSYGNGTVSPGSTFVPTPPTRLLDTRTSGGGGPLGPGESRNLAVGGVIPVPSSATAIVANVTVANATHFSLLTLYPGGSTTPTASNLNFLANQTVANLVSVKLGPDHSINIFNSLGSVNVIVDLEGYFTATGDASGSRFFPIVNHRILDTRANVGGFSVPLGPGGSDSVQTVGAGGVIDGASGVVMNLTEANASSFSLLEVYPAGAGRPLASNLNFPAHSALANLVSVPIGNGGQDVVYNSLGYVNAIEDVVGWYGAPGA